MANPNYLNNLEFFGLSDIGLGRANNEDVFFLLPQYQFFVLADGMGGHKAGEVAAEEAASFLSSSIEETFLSMQNKPCAEELQEILKNTIKKANRYIHHLGTKHKKYEGMGTTLCSILFYEKEVIYGHVGDSRIYRFRQGELSQLTRDHSLKNELIAQGYRVENMKEKINNVLTKAVGTSLDVTPDVNMVTAQLGDIFLTCSDGLSDVVSDMRIQEIFSMELSVAETVQALVDEALANGGGDNITAVVIKIKNLS
ncbi:MAG: Stp1/IreP family PP2C-type Ser/Thr phosphatase [Simkaniaceae bacterium]